VVRRGLIVGLVAAVLGVLPSAAGASLVLGSTTEPSGAGTEECGTSLVTMQDASDPATTFQVPAPGGFITQWQINDTGIISAGGQETLVVLRANGESPGSDGYTVVGTDTESFPSVLPADGVLTFRVASPIAVQAGDVFGVTGTSSGQACVFAGGQTPLADFVGLLPASGTPTAGETLKETGGTAQDWVIDLAVTLAQQQDAAVSATAGPSGAIAGDLAQLSATVTNDGPATESITFSDTVPSGLAIQSSVAGSGSCSIAGQSVSCTLTGLPAGASAPVVITVLPGVAGQYANTVSVATTAGEPDPTPGDNIAHATLSVAAGSGAGKIQCVVPVLARTPLAVAKHVLKLLHCRAGRVTKKSSRKVSKGEVIGTRPRAGSYSPGKAVAITESSGPPRRRARR
jgi:uncharacterized repeat protein (TIGR01451 family)